MLKRNLFALFSFLTLFLVSGCGQEQAETKKPADTVKQEEKTETPTATEKKEEIPDQSKVETPELSELKVHYIDVGQADSTLLQFAHDGEDFTILIDTGNWNGNQVVNYLNSQRVKQIDIAVGTHPDADHIGQLDKVIDNFDVGEVWLSGNTNPSQTFQRLISSIETKNIDYHEPRLGEEFEIGPLMIEVLHPKTITENDNDESISLKLTYGAVRFIFTGDASTDDEFKMLQSGMNVKADILQLGHHGSNTSTHPKFLSEVSPDVAIYSAGLDNTYGHPHEEVVTRIQKAGIKLYGTDVHGTVIVTTDGKDYQVLTKKDGTISPSSAGGGKTTTDDSNYKKSDPKPITGQCIDVNSASFEQVQQIKHIGTARAEELISIRPFTSIDDLGRIKGIGPARIKDIKAEGLACIGG